ncbi:hypothetical protein G7066_02960 [Leucobacter coleopterorum]|uniref:Big-1 domain-containing protein n=1 Tax=Leucobacter coleopterorum TaxID=2714933 RepID=A0ABX6JUE0_9MICO|nr:Ig-like domain-containing protein [Leucobacter coleopterorum]QIM17906.1 hypothetical protein G7066_02960 [Leucobacter coleopterorum]
MISSSLAGNKVISTLYGSNPISVLGNATAAFVAGGVDTSRAGTKYSVSGGDASVLGGSHQVTVHLVDGVDNPVSGQAASLKAVASGGAVVGDFTESTDTPGMYTAAVTSATAGNKSVTVKHDTNTVNASGNTTARFIAGGVDTNAPGTNYSVSTGSRVAGATSHTVTVNLTDTNGNVVAGQAGGLTGSASGGAKVSNFSETGTAGTYTATVTSNTAGDKTVTVTYGANPVNLNGNGVAVFVAGLVDLGHANTNYSVSGGNQIAGAGSHTVTVKLADANGNSVAGKEADLSGAATGSAQVSAFKESAVTAGTYTATVTSNVAGNKTVTVKFESGSVSANGNDIAKFVAGSVDTGADATRYTVSTGTRVAGTGVHTVTVTLADTHGNPVSGEAAPLSWSSVPGSVVPSAFVETATPGTYTATLASTVAGAKTIKVHYGALPVTLGANDTATFVAGAVDLGKSSTAYQVSGGDASVEGGSHQVTVTLVDALDNPVPAQSGLLAAAVSGGAVVSSFTESTTAPGTYTAQVTSATAGNKSVTVRYGADAVNASGNTTARFVAGGVDTGVAGTNYTVSTGTRVAGSGAHTVTVMLADKGGNVVSGQGSGLSATADGGLGGGGVSTFTETATAGTYTATITSTLAGVKTIAVSYGANPLTLKVGGNTKASFIAGEVDTDNAATRYTVSTGDAVAGSGSHQVTVTLADVSGNAVSGKANDLVGAASGGAAVTNFTESLTTPGTYTATVTSNTSGDKIVTVRVAGTLVKPGLNSTARFIAGEVDPNSAGTKFKVSTGNRVAGSGAHTVTVTLSDAYGNPVSGQATPLSWSSASSLGGNSVTGFAETAVPGTYTAAILSSVAGEKVISAFFGATPLGLVASGNDTAVFVAGAVDLNGAGTGYSVSSGEKQVVGGSHTVTVTLVDGLENPVSGQKNNLVATATGGAQVASFVESATPGTYTATVTATTVGSKKVTVKLSGSDVKPNGNDTAVFVAGDVDTNNVGTSYSVSGGTQLSGTGAHTVTATLVDANGNPVTGQAAGLESAATDGGVVSSFTETAAVPGEYTASVTSSTAGVKTVTVKFSGSTVNAGSNNTKANFIAGGVDLGNAATNYTVSTGSQVVASGSHKVTVKLADANSNPVSGEAAQLSWSSATSLGVFSVTAFVETATPGTYVATILSSSAGEKVISVNHNGSPITLTGNGTALFAAGDVDLGLARTGYVVSSGEVAIGNGSHSVTVNLADAFGNPIAGLANRISAQTTDPWVWA